MGNPCNPLEWIRSAQDWFSRTERQSGFRPFLLFIFLVDGMGLTVLTLFKDIVTRYVALGTIALSTLFFIILYFIKAFTDPNFRRSETHIENPRVIRKNIPPNSSVRTNYVWLKTHRQKYRGNWIGLRNGELVGVDTSLENLIKKVGETKGILLTKAW